MTKNVKQLFGADLSTIDKIHLVTHVQREYTVADNLSQQLSKSVSFETTIKNDDTGASVEIAYKNIKLAEGRMCILASGKKI